MRQAVRAGDFEIIVVVEGVHPGDTDLLSGLSCNIVIWIIPKTHLAMTPSESRPRISDRERRVSGRQLGWRALHFATASEGFIAERVNWHRHEGVEVLMFLRGAAEYEFRGGRRLALTGDQFLIVPPGLAHRAARDVRSPTVHSSITLDLSVPSRNGSPFTSPEMDWLRAHFGEKRPVVRAMSPVLRREAQRLHHAVRQFPDATSAPDEAARLRFQIAGILIEAARAGEQRAEVQEEGIVPAAMAHLERHFAKPVQIDAVAEAVGCSRSRLYAVFKAETGLSPNDWLVRLRVEKATALLEGTNRAVVEIAEATGFSSHAYFCQVFRRYTGRTPGDLRRSVG